eukprot:3813880-Rhodomonas_salina.2
MERLTTARVRSSDSEHEFPACTSCRYPGIYLPGMEETNFNTKMKRSGKKMAQSVILGIEQQPYKVTVQIGSGGNTRVD